VLSWALRWREFGELAFRVEAGIHSLAVGMAVTAAFYPPVAPVFLLTHGQIARY